MNIRKAIVATLAGAMLMLTITGCTGIDPKKAAVDTKSESAVETIINKADELKSEMKDIEGTDKFASEGIKGAISSIIDKTKDAEKSSFDNAKDTIKDAMAGSTKDGFGKDMSHLIGKLRYKMEVKEMLQHLTDLRAEALGLLDEAK